MIIQDEEFAIFVQNYERLIFTICLSLVKNYFDAEDLAQETFLSAYKALNKFDGKNIKAWLSAIAVNKCKDYLKSPAKSTILLSNEDYDCLEGTQDAPSESLEQKALEEKVHILCRRLKEPYQTVSLNYFCFGIKLSDMAKDSGQSLKTLQTQLYRSKKLLKALWKEEPL